MIPDYDLSNLPSAQAEMWLRLRTDDIRKQLIAAQAEQMGFSLALGNGIVSAMA